MTDVVKYQEVQISPLYLGLATGHGEIAKPPQRRRQVLDPSIPKSSNQKDPSLVIQEQRRKQNHQETPKPYTTINIDKAPA
jgi:hypothetical protein